MQLDDRAVKFKIKPASYPSIKICYKEPQKDYLEAEVAFPKEFWIDLANGCKQVTDNMGTFSSQNLAAAIDLMSNAIMGEISAEEKRIRNKEAYESFVDFVMEINSRADLDKARKGQLIHNEAWQLRLQP